MNFGQAKGKNPVRNDEVAGSNPVTSTQFTNDLDIFFKRLDESGHAPAYVRE